jgi:hypothetical protein
MYVFEYGPLDNGVVREVIINGERMPYDAMSSSGNLVEAKEFYSNYNYIGASREYFINGKL